MQAPFLSSADAGFAGSPEHRSDHGQRFGRADAVKPAAAAGGAQRQARGPAERANILTARIMITLFRT
jgi:hypothetical protein